MCAMGRIMWKFRTLLAVAYAGDFHTPANRIRRWVDSKSHFYGLRRDLTISHRAPPAKVPLRVRALRHVDIPALLDNHSHSGRTIYDLMDRREFMKVMRPINCFVAVTQDGKPCYMQWLITPAENMLIREHFGGLFPWLAADEVLLEQAYTAEEFRGLGIMPFAMSQIAEVGRSYGARWAITFVGHDNIPALKGCKRAGFRPYLIRREKWKWFQREISFEVLPSGAIYPFEEPASGSAGRRLWGADRQPAGGVI